MLIIYGGQGMNYEDMTFEELLAECKRRGILESLSDKRGVRGH